MPDVADLRSSLSALKGAVLLLFTDVIGSLFLWASLPVAKEQPVAAGVTALLVMFGSTAALLWLAWTAGGRPDPATPPVNFDHGGHADLMRRMGRVAPEAPSVAVPAGKRRLAVMNDVLYTILMIKAGLVFAALFSPSLTTPGKDREFGVGAFVVSLVVLLIGLRLYRKRLRA